MDRKLTLKGEKHGGTLGGYIEDKEIRTGKVRF
jgi:hypothetical protein